MLVRRELAGLPAIVFVVYGTHHWLSGGAVVSIHLPIHLYPLARCLYACLRGVGFAIFTIER
ncbi:hypothetical protein DFP73DRAFT_565321 [Morchella snyderi]|nr:hypothetical protein DFP73DRAFT_565321 [Morchella snyderi]